MSWSLERVGSVCCGRPAAEGCLQLRVILTSAVFFRGQALEDLLNGAFIWLTPGVSCFRSMKYGCGWTGGKR